VVFDLRHVSREEIDERVQFWIDCVQSRCVGVSYLSLPPVVFVLCSAVLATWRGTTSSSSPLFVAVNVFGVAVDILDDVFDVVVAVDVLGVLVIVVVLAFASGAVSLLFCKRLCWA